MSHAYSSGDGSRWWAISGASLSVDGMCPVVKIEAEPTGRSTKCRQCKQKIKKGVLRLEALPDERFNYDDDGYDEYDDYGSCGGYDPDEMLEELEDAIQAAKKDANKKWHYHVDCVGMNNCVFKKSGALFRDNLRVEVTRLLGKELIDKVCPPRKHKNQADSSAKHAGAAAAKIQPSGVSCTMSSKIASHSEHLCVDRPRRKSK